MQPSWEKFNFKKLQLKSKTIALFGLGDSQIYSFTFCNGLYKLYKKITICKEIKLVGQVDSKQYKYSESKAVIKNKFVGLVLDYDNFPNDVPKLIKK